MRGLLYIEIKKVL